MVEENFESMALFMSKIEQKQAKKNHLTKKKKKVPKEMKMKIETHMIHEAVILGHL